MPTYEYACDACGHGFEKEQRITEKPLKKCPSCGKLKARRLIGSGNFILKGGGWYADLYSGPSNRKESGSSNGSEGKAAKESSGSKDGGSKDSGSKDGGSKDSSSKPSGSSDGGGGSKKAAAAN